MTAAGRPDRRLPRERRLDPAGYRAAFDGARSQAGRCLVLWLRTAGAGPAQRVGVVASRRSFPTAVARNRARRRLREVFRLSRSALRAGVDMVLVARPRILDAPFDAVRADFRSVCLRLGIWENRT